MAVLAAVALFTTARAASAQDADLLIKIGLEYFQKALRAKGRGRQGARALGRRRKKTKSAEPLILAAAAEHFLGRAAPEIKAREHFEQVKRFADEALARDKDSVQAGYWLAVSLIELLEKGEPTAYLRERTHIKRLLDAALAEDPAYQFGGPDRFLARFHFRSPVRDYDAAEKHLQAAVKIAPHDSRNFLLLAELLIERKRPGEARAALDAIDAIQAAPEFAGELAADREKAAALRKRLDA
ncbi:MAG: tetratricopeptide repeat protein [Deltaproteobacteria bacterium]|nr:tetratricopeptide repeat protein [Deltaproteobacteria bacterium]